MTLRHFTGASEPIIENPWGTSEFLNYRRAMGMVSSAEYDVFFEDFQRLVTTNVPSGWTAAVIDTGATATLSTVAGSLGATGGLLIGSDGANEGAAVYLPKAVQLTSGKRFYMEVRVQTDLVLETTVQFGLSDLTATSNPEDLWTTAAANVVAFGTLAGSGYPKMLSDKSNGGTTAQAQTVATLVNATWASMAIGFNGTYLTGWVNGHKVLDWAGAAATIPTGVALAPFIGGLTGATAGNTTTFDYVRYVIER